MSPPDELAAHLPPPVDEEPPALGRDILDELADHLACAERRERRRGGDDADVRRRVLQRFGDPSRIARRLWLDAMKERLMQQRIMLATNVLLALTCIVLCVVALTALRQNARLGEAIVARLATVAPAPAAADSIWAHATVVVNTADGRAIPGLRVSLNGSPFNAGESESVRARLDEDGRYAFGPIRPGKYELRMTDGSRGLTVTRHVTLYPGEQDMEPITWRDQFDVVPVAFETPWPADIADRVEAMVVRVHRSVADAEAFGNMRVEWSFTSIAIRPDGTSVHEGELGLAYERNEGWRVDGDAPFAPTMPLESALEYRLNRIQILVRDQEGTLHAVNFDRHRMAFRDYFRDLEPFRFEPGADVATWRIDLPQWLFDATSREIADLDRPGDERTRSNSRPLT